MQRRKRLPLILVLSLLISVVILVPSAAKGWGVMEDLKVSNATYFDGNHSLKSLDTSFDWIGDSATSRLVLMTNRLQSNRADNSYGDLTDLGYYGSMFSTFSDAQTHDHSNQTFGFVNYSDEYHLGYNSSNQITFQFEETDISLSENRDYYVYLWTHYNDHYYPDYLVAVIRVKDGNVTYTAPTEWNEFDNNGFIAISEPPAKPEQAEPTTKSEQIEALPQTGDNSQLAFWMALVIFCFTTAWIILRRNRISRI